MGSCYSQQAQQTSKYSQTPGEPPSTDTDYNMPHPTTSGPDQPLTDSSLRKPQTTYYNAKTNRNSNEQSSRDSDRTALGTMTNGENESKKGNIGAGRFGFKSFGRRDKPKSGDNKPAHGNGLAVSTDSLNSASSTDKGTRSLPSSKHSSFKRAYMPRSNTGSWKMIDDTSSAYSDKSRDKLAERAARSRTATPGLGTDDVHNGNASADTTPVKILPLVAAPIAIVESMETISGGSVEDARAREQMHAPRPNVSNSAGNGTNNTKFQSRLRGPFKKSSSVAGKGPNHGNHGNQSVAHDESHKWIKSTSEQTQPKGGASGSKSNTGGAYFKRGFLRKQKTTGDNVAQKKDGSSRNGTTTAVNKSGKYANGRKQSGEKCNGTEKEISVVKEEKISPRTQGGTEHARIPSIDALETTSIGSIHSDDLMLDLDLDEYEELGTAPSVERSKPTRTRSRSRSGSRSRSRDNKERRMSGGATTDKHGDRIMMTAGHRGSESGIPGVTKRQSPVEPIQELANLLESNHLSGGAQRRQQRLQNATRPASFPGPQHSVSSEASHGGSTILRPPRQSSVHADEDLISIDSFTYRHLVQDVTTFKTMLLKLKRLIQEDEFHGQNWKNGFKLSSSQPNSPYEETSKFSFAASLDAEEAAQNGANATDVFKENQELKQQLQSVHHQMEEQERTIKLLQQQMTKYECGYSEPGGKAYCHASTQTDKQTSGFYKAGSYRSACVRRTSSSTSQPAPRYSGRTEFRAQGRNSITDEVFMDNESCDIDDDLDLLMEDVSLCGSEYCSSVGDNFSHGGSFRGTSITSPLPTPTEHKDTSLSHHGREQFPSHGSRESSFSFKGRTSVMSQQGRDSSLSYHGRDSSLSHHGRDSSLSQHGKDRSLSHHSRESSLSQSIVGSLSRNDEPVLCRQDSSSSQSQRPTSLNLSTSEDNTNINKEDSHLKLEKETDLNIPTVLDLHIREDDDSRSSKTCLRTHTKQPEKCNSPNVSDSKMDKIPEIDQNQSASSTSLNLSDHSDMAANASPSYDSSSSVKIVTQPNDSASVQTLSQHSTDILVSSEGQHVRSPDSQAHSKEQQLLSSHSPDDRSVSPSSPLETLQSPSNCSGSSRSHSDSLPSSSDVSLTTQSPGGSKSPPTQSSLSNNQNRSRSKSRSRSRSRSPRDRQSEQDNMRNEAIIAFSPETSENNNVNKPVKEVERRSPVDNSQRPVFRKQDCLEPHESMEIIEANELTKHTHKPLTKGSSVPLPSGRITNWSNPKPARPSRLPPPRPSQLPARAATVKHSHSEDLGKSESALKAPTKSFRIPTPTKDEQSDFMLRQPTQDKAGGKKRRQLPSLAFVHMEHSQVPPVTSQSQASRLPRAPPGGQTGTQRGGSQMRYSADPGARRNARGRAK